MGDATDAHWIASATISKIGTNLLDAEAINICVHLFASFVIPRLPYEALLSQLFHSCLNCY